MPDPELPVPEDDDVQLLGGSSADELPVWPDFDSLQFSRSCFGERPSPPLFAFALDAIQDMIGHGSAETSHEVGGILLGQFVQVAQGPLTRVDEIIIADSAEASLTHVTFTHESWTQIHRQLDQRTDNLRIVGWYHTHPGFGPFLSGQDFFIQRNFFDHPMHVALVLDPVQHLFSTFGWANGDILKSRGCYIYGGPEQAEELQTLTQTLAYAGEKPWAGWFSSLKGLLRH